jgi:hypothetical protein
VHLVCLPLAIVVAAIAPCVFALARDVVETEHAHIAGPIVPVKLPMSVLCSIDVRSFVPCLIRPSFHSMTVLLVVFPLAIVDCTIVVDVLAKSICLVIAPLTLIDVAI